MSIFSIGTMLYTSYDTWHQDLDEAKDQAWFEFESILSEWVEIPLTYKAFIKSFNLPALSGVKPQGRNGFMKTKIENNSSRREVYYENQSSN
ncbi:MAG: hypothetical protein U0231_04555 [Nitrospiraceae bacterium]